jgi:CHAT domain-containing protein
LDRSKVVVVRRLAIGKEISRQLSLLRLNLAGVTHLLAETIEPEAKTERLKQAENNVCALLHKLYRQLIAPLTEHLQGYRNLVIVPHGVLHYLPFHALYHQSAGRYLLEEWQEISYLPSGNLLSFCYKRSQHLPHQRGQGALVMGYSNGGSLTYCLSEAQAVSELLNKNPATSPCQLYLEEEAQHQRFEAEAEQRQLIHLATHAQFRQDDPLFSALLLAGGELTAQDLFNSELKASLVVFSACETGLGSLSGGDELLGLSRACLYAGASSLLLSLWRVEDQSVAELMQTFYSRLLAGERKGTALRQAQLTLLQSDSYRHPFFWAPFILIGHPGLL